MQENLDNEHEKRLHAEAETRGALAALDAEGGLNRREEVRGARLGQEAQRLSFATAGLMEEIRKLVW